jgi:hypothetical protein
MKNKNVSQMSLLEYLLLLGLLNDAFSCFHYIALNDSVVSA